MDRSAVSVNCLSVKAGGKKSVRVVGAGLGGLSAAIHLANAGFHVEVFEKNSTVGGKAAEYHAKTRAGNFRWDVGPSLLTMPDVLREILALAGEQYAESCPLLRISPTCRYFWSDGTVVDEDDVFWSREDVRKYLNYAEGIYKLSGEVYLRSRPQEWWRALFNLNTWGALRHFPKIATFCTLHDLNTRFFHDPKLVQLFDRFATYNGSSPYVTPATFAIIPYIEHAFGSWLPEGGMARLPEVLYNAAQSLGVKFYFNHEVRDLVGDGVTPTVCNADVLSAEGWLPSQEARTKRLRQRPLSCSAWVMLLAVRGSYTSLSHHNIFFSDNYHREFEHIFLRGRLPEEPTIYISVTSRHVPGDAPNGCENWFVLVNAPAEPELNDSGYENVVLERLQKFGVEVKQDKILHFYKFGPRYVRDRDNSWRGALYGWASHSPMSAALRPPMRHPTFKNVFFCGGSTHPGGGIPLVLLSGKIVARAVVGVSR